MNIQPKIRGYICTTAHPQGCAQNVADQIDYVKQRPAIVNGPKKVLVIGGSTGYGLASVITAATSANAKTINVFFEREAEGTKRTASPGWYNVAAFENAAHSKGLYAKSINGDAFSDEIKEKTIDLIRQDWQGGVDLVVYSVAAPRRRHPKTGEIFNSVLKPIGKNFSSKTVDVMTGEVSHITIEPATPEEIKQTTAVMGGEDWDSWIEALLNANVLADGFKTVAYSYIGPDLTFPIYREGTIGKAKENLEATAHSLTKKLSTINGHAFISVNKALVTQASAAIPVVPLYMSLLFKVMKEKNLHEGCIEQIQRLFADHLYNAQSSVAQNLIRIDDKEMREDIQKTVADYWEKVDSHNLSTLADIKGYRHDFYKLFGFEVEGVDYSSDADPAVTIPSLSE